MPLTKADVTRLRSLQEKKHREAAGLFVVEGEKVVGELLAAGFPFAELYATEAWRAPAARLAISPVAVTAAEMARASLAGQPVHLLSPLVPSTYLLVGLAKVEFGDHQKFTL
mgnify:CR=1 FL=1